MIRMLYQEASRIIDQVHEKKGTVKSLIHCGSHKKNIKQLYALVCQTLKYSSTINQILATSSFLEHEKWLSKSMAQILVYELLFGKGVQCGGKYRLAIKRHKSSLNAALARIKIKMGVIDNKDLLPDSVKEEVNLPRYVRVNTLKMTVHDAVQQFLADGLECILTKEQADIKRAYVENANSLSKLHVEMARSLTPKQFMCDVHLQELLVFPSATDFHDHPLYKSGSIILQDKASCLPAYLLAPPPGSHVIDACAAPGNKTSHLAAILNNTGKVFAFDVNANRVLTMTKLTKLSGATNIDIENQDFLAVNPLDEKFANVRYILVDPSCSGSGIVSRLDHVTNDIQSDCEERLQALATVQAKLLSHALTFPSVERVVYSTCSVHRIENEDVVVKVLNSCAKFDLEFVMPIWENRGITIKDDSASFKTVSETQTEDIDVRACLRAQPKDDLTNGFFVAVIQRCPASSSAEQSVLDKAETGPGDKKTRSKNRKRKRRRRTKNSEPSSKVSKIDTHHASRSQVAPLQRHQKKTKVKNLPHGTAVN